MRRFNWLGVLGLVLGCGGNPAAGSGHTGVGGETATGGASAIAGATMLGGTTAAAGATATGGSVLIIAGTTALSTHVPTELTGQWSSEAPGADRASQLAQLAALDTMSTEQLIARSSGGLNETLGYSPASARWLDSIQSSPLALNDHELQIYGDKGLVISDRQSFANFFYGYKSIYAADLPLYITADSVLSALHRSFDDILIDLERSYLSSTLERLLAALRANLATSSISERSKQDLGLLLGVAAGLLSANSTGLDSEMQALITKAEAASGTETLSLFGRDRMIDFSQFTPRGHYADRSTLERYFRAMMWLGRTELRLVDVREDGTRELVRREVQDVLALQELMTPELRAQWEAIDGVVSLFAGEPDYMTLTQVQSLWDALKIESSLDLANVADDVLLATIDAGNFGLQRICSQLMMVDDGNTRLPNSFAFLGQRYTVDSHVFSKVVYPNTAERRMMPNPLDVAFAAFGNDQAAPLLRSELDTYGYASSLAKARQLVEWHDPGYWDSSIYTLWVGALRQLSAGKYDATPLPSIARTEAWGRRLLNTQLGSWAELRHDTLLYAKQSYTGIPLCEYPDGYVDPYPGLFGRLRQLGTLVAEKLSVVLPADFMSGSGRNPITYFETFANVAARLEAMATQELTGAPRTQADLDFINDAVVIESKSVICASIDTASGWYARLFYNDRAPLEPDPTIADVHTQPADAAGNLVGKVLHVATGSPRLMVVSVDSCDGPRAYAGVVSAYFEQTTNDFVRKTDEQWATELQAATPSDVGWMQDLVAR